MNIAQVLADRAAAHPDRPAIIHAHRRGGGRRDRTISFAGLDASAAHIAATLTSRGVKPGDPILILQGMSIDLYAILIGAFRAGAIAMFVDPSAGLGRVAAACELARPVGVVTNTRSEILRLASPAIRRIPLKFSIGPRLLPATPLDRFGSAPAAAPIVPRDPSDPALLTFTTGSTGQPKAAQRSHGLLIAQQQAIAAALNLAPGSSDLATLPIFVLANLASGITTIIPDADLARPDAIDGPAVLAQIRRLGPASTVASPALLGRLAEASQHGNVHGSPNAAIPLRRIFTGGAPIFLDDLDRFAAAAPDADIVNLYGSTEAEPIAHISRSDISAEDRREIAAGRGILVGHPIPTIHLRILPDTFGTPIPPMSAAELDARALPVGQIGEVVVSGPHVLPGYLSGAGDAETKFRVGTQMWHRTGDAGRLDARGRLWLAGRCSARLTPSLYPTQVEAAARTVLPSRRIAALAIDSQPTLIVQSPGPLAPDTESTLRRALAWAPITRILTTPHIPVDPRHNAKIDYAALAAALRRSP